MKKIIALILVMITLILCAACGNSQKSDDEIKIGIAAPDVTHGWVAGVAYYAEKYCQNNNIVYKITTSSDAAEMAGDLQDLVAWGADVIIMYPQWTGMESAVAEVIEDGVNVVCFDFDIETEGVYKVTGDNYGMGYESAKYIVDRVGEAATIVITDVPSFGSVSGLRKEGFYAYLDEIGYDKSNIIEVSCESFTREEGLDKMSDILLTNQQIDAVFSMDDEVALGCIQAIKEAGRTDIKAITGGGGMQEYFRVIADSENADLGPVSVLYSPMMIQNAIDAAIKLCNGENIEGQIVVPTAIVSSDNVHIYIDIKNTIY